MTKLLSGWMLGPVIALLVASIAEDSVALAAPQFQIIPPLNGAPSIPSAISSDGAVVVGTASLNGVDRAFRWTNQGGTQSLGVASGAVGSSANAVSADGSVVVGDMRYANQQDRGFRWTAIAGFQQLAVLSGMTNSVALGVSANGAVIVGSSGNSQGYFPARWVTPLLAQNLGLLSGFTLTQANNVSGDGSVAFGIAFSGGATHAARWVNGEAPQDLGVFDGNYANPRAASFDGETIVGMGVSLPFRWTLGGGMQALPMLPNATAGNALGVSSDGGTVIGNCYSPAPNRAWVWTQNNGTRLLTDVLAPSGIQFPSSWTNVMVMAISADGLSFAGVGADSSGNSQGWIARIGGPSLVTLDLSPFAGMPNTANVVVPFGSRLSNQFLYTDGILFSSGAPFAAIVNVGSSVGPAGQTALMSAAPNSRLSLTGAYPIRGTFFSPNNGVTPAVTDYVSVQADLVGGTGNAVLTAFGLDGSVLATKSVADVGGEQVSVSVPGIHRWEFTGDGTIYIGNIRFGTVSPRCAGDLTLDLAVDDADFVAFANGYDILICADQAMPAGCPADLNADGTVDDSDFVVFAAAYDVFLCP